MAWNLSNLSQQEKTLLLNSCHPATQTHIETSIAACMAMKGGNNDATYLKITLDAALYDLSGFSAYSIEQAKIEYRKNTDSFFNYGKFIEIAEKLDKEIKNYASSIKNAKALLPPPIKQEKPKISPAEIDAILEKHKDNKPRVSQKKIAAQRDDALLDEQRVYGQNLNKLHEELNQRPLIKRPKQQKESEK
jgi:hypothetical protein